MYMPYSVKAHCLDASALVKLVADDADEEPGREVLRTYYRNHSSRYSTSFCVAEALSAFKQKFLRNKITRAEYIKDVRNHPYRNRWEPADRRSQPAEASRRY